MSAKRGPGRPWPPGPRATARATVRLTPERREILRAYASGVRTSESALIEHALEAIGVLPLMQDGDAGKKST